jgi:hypothetical protein
VIDVARGAMTELTSAFRHEELGHDWNLSGRPPRKAAAQTANVIGNGGSRNSTIAARQVV